LADARIDPNYHSEDGFTAFSDVVYGGQKDVVALLLADPRVDPCKRQAMEQHLFTWPATKVTRKWFHCY